MLTKPKNKIPMTNYPSALEAILIGKPYHVKALFIMGGNPVLTIAIYRWLRN
ncbi:hypothetical protein FFONT_0173 [Fervidicoccus fontis Kam940]|uniref:Uncharacterized protein n=1 Tax=Fervidicoccus fontis (strain DSM 19380 / JCM 18336 / VKM B-2539 / Kam940) TaxID=1163730 RepID=H9ZZK8_FERFK|nr:hypothetical protein [Fervidicoccus fontis]AFH42165.1 hypothetical protein FFONT_0173 [Fervidicoccus fontis Kam940]